VRSVATFSRTFRRSASVGQPAGRGWGVRLAVAISLALVVDACGGGSSPARPAVCKLKAQRAIARDLGVSSRTVGYARSVANNGMPQCSFRVRAAGRTVVVTVNVDNGPQPYFRLLRTVDEATQIFGIPPPGFHAPEGLSGLGPFASWFPNEDHLMATNYRLLLTVTVAWPGAGRDAEVALARAAVVPYLVRPHGPLNDRTFP
jgi:hypothetical protein